MTTADPAQCGRSSAKLPDDATDAWGLVRLPCDRSARLEIRFRPIAPAAATYRRIELIEADDFPLADHESPPRI